MSHFKLLELSLFGESHGSFVGGVLLGFPAGYEIDMDEVDRGMARRIPDQFYASERKEPDGVEILSGIYQGKTTGSPLAFMIKNKDYDSKPYAELSEIFRPGHADYTADARYKSFNDPRGGGHLSGRLTAPLTFAGLLAKNYLEEKKGIKFQSRILEIGGESESAKFESILSNVGGDSIGGIIGVTVAGLPLGLGTPIFDNVESRLSSILFSIPGVKGVEFGDGFKLARMKGSETNDAYEKVDGKVRTKTNHAGGILGGITTGEDLVFQVAFKPTPSISKEQKTLNFVSGEEVGLRITGRHDPCIAWRAGVICEASAALVALDLILEHDGYQRT